MPQLGNQSIGFTFSISGAFGDVAGGWYQVPSPGIFVNTIHAYFGANGGGGNYRLYVWASEGGDTRPADWFIRGSSTHATPSGEQWNADSNLAYNTGNGSMPADGYLPGGYRIWIGYYSSTGISAFQGSSSGKTELGNTADGKWNDHGAAGGGMGYAAAYFDYTPLAAPTLSAVSPAVAPAGGTVTLTGTALNHTSGITVCGVSAPTYTVNSDTSITLTIPAGASGAGQIAVTTPAGTATIAFTAGQLYYGDSSGNGAVHSIAGVWYGTGSGVARVAGIWVPNGGGVKRVW